MLTGIDSSRTQARAATILPNFVGLTFQVYNGKIYQSFTVTEAMVRSKDEEQLPSAEIAPFPPLVQVLMSAGIIGRS